MCNLHNSHQTTFRQEPNSSKFSAENYYVSGINQFLEGNYQAAIENYTQAIQLKPNFQEAYLKRCEAYFAAKQDRQVLADCQTILKLDNTCYQAYFYQGRSRQLLGYTQSAIESYTQAIHYQNSCAEAYYYRGLAYDELKEIANVLQDLQKAAKLFNEQGDRKNYNLAQNKLQQLFGKTPTVKSNIRQSGTPGIFKTIQLPVTTFLSCLFNPGGNLLAVFSRLSSRQALLFGVLYGAIADILITISLHYLNHQAYSLSIQTFLVNFLPFISLVSCLAIIELILRQQIHIVASIFISGLSILPVSCLIALAYSPLTVPQSLLLIISIFVICLTILILYFSFTQIYNFSEKVSTWLVPILITILAVILSILSNFI